MQNMVVNLSTPWYILLFLTSIFGVATWFCKNIWRKKEATQLFAFSGIFCMLGLVFLTMRV
ncbi:MAG TPA: hypothetical protein D7H86_05500 [Candidatus Poseidoniales archaeon]|nr:MAG TPA: hypothetical protein D7H86_05500 [Candidatus Poseidoniales archaeon]